MGFNSLLHFALERAQYKDSKLSQKAFCKEKGLSWNHFRYRWERRKPLKKCHAKSLILENNLVHVSFESIAIKTAYRDPEEELNITEASIYLPNQIRCGVKVNLQSNTLVTLLKQLVTLC